MQSKSLLVPGARRSSLIAVMAAVCLLAPSLLTGVASAAPPAITTTSDSATPGSGSLREAIAGASAGDTIVVPASATPYTVTLGEIPIGNPITIKGAGAGLTVINAQGMSRVFHVTTAVSPSATVTFEALTITGGSTTSMPGGGGIYDQSGALVLSGVTMTGNSVNLGAGPTTGTGGGAVFIGDGALTVSGSTLTNNSATIDDPATFTHGGAAIYEDGGAVTITASTISSNHTTITAATCCNGGAVYQNSNFPVTVQGSHMDNNTFTETNGTQCCSGGAAIYQDGSSNGSTTITDSTLNGNAASITDNNCCDGGGAVFQDSTAAVTLNGATLNGNSTTVSSQNCCSGGGAISAFDPIIATSSTLDSNTANVTDANCCDGGGAVNVDTGSATLNASSLTSTEIVGNSTTVDSTNPAHDCCEGGGAFYNDTGPGSLTVISSDISDNNATVNSPDSSGGGGILGEDGHGEVLTNTTVSGNSTNASGATDGGGGILFNQASATEKLSFVTLAGNTAASASGGGIFAAGSTVFTKNSILALNSAGSSANCSGAGSPTFTSLGHNLEDSPDTCNFIAAGDKVVPAGSVGLGSLASNGGPTMTRALLAGSPAIDAIPIAACTDQASPPQAVTTDQRGVARPLPAGGSCDVGAFEFGPADLALSGATTAVPVKVGQDVTLTFTASNAGPAPATSTALSVSLPAGLAFVSATATQGTCGAASGGASCALGTLSVGTAAVASIVVEPTAPGSFTATGSITSTAPDATPSDNTRSLALTAIAKPLITHPSQSHAKWRERKKTSREHHLPPVGTVFSFTLNENAAVTFTFTQPAPGRKVGHRCVAPTKKNSKRRKCTRTITRGTLSLTGHPGRNQVSFAGRISRTHKLTPGRYTLLITAVAGGMASNVVKLTFTIVTI